MLLAQKEITHVHLTGAKTTSDVIKKVYGESRSHLSSEDIKARVTSELGCATPVIISPGKYSKTEMKNCARNIVTGKKMFSGSNCLGSQVIVLSQSWNQKDEFRTVLKEELKLTYTDPSYYPGSLDRVKQFISKYDANNVEQIRGTMIPRSRYHNEKMEYSEKELQSWSNDHHTYIIECGVVGTDGFNSYAIDNEIFGPILAIVEVPDNNDKITNIRRHESPDIQYLTNSAVPFVNDKIFGTLSCQLMYPTRKNSLFTSYKKMETQIKQHVISKLNYGTVTVNTYALAGYSPLGFGGQWGAHLKDKEGHSGNGYVGNGYGLRNVDKTVVYGARLSLPILLSKRYLLPALVMDLASNLVVWQSRVQSLIKLCVRRCTVIGKYKNR